MVAAANLNLHADVLIATNSTWRYFKGLAEASNPDTTAWRQVGFDDSGWASGLSAFYYENQPGSANAYTGNTVLTDMDGHYTCLFMRRAFVVSNLLDFVSLQLVALSDDGFVAWLNGQEIARFNMPAGDLPYNGASNAALPEPVPWYTNTLAAQDYLVAGTNVLAIQAFNSSLGSSSDFIIWPGLYAAADHTPPGLTLVYPATNSTVRQLTSIEVAFSKPVAGVDAGDLLIDGRPATSLTLVTPAQFVFNFPQPATGSVQVAWSATAAIRDLTSASNAFAGGSWTYTLNTNAPLSGVYISEFLAANSGKQTNSLHDELGDTPDWIELHNASAVAADLTGWSLTDDPAKPAKWQFPSTLLPANGYLVVFASGRDTNVAGQLHTNFKLSSSPGYLALFDPAGNLISGFSPTYPQQYTDVSYGRDQLDPSLIGYYTNPTPGAANTTQGAGFGPEVIFSRVSGTFVTDFSLALSTTDTNCDIHYLLIGTNLAYGTPAVTNIPTASSPIYTTPLLINNTFQLRARAFPRSSGFWPGPPHTESYIKLVPYTTTFTSDLPVLLFHNLGGGALSSTAAAENQSVILMVFEPINGKTTLTNPPTLVTRAGFNIRGRSTAGNPQYNLALELWDEYNQDKQMPLLGLPAESDWVLYAQDVYDPSYLHNPLTHQLCRDTGRYSSRTRFAEAFLNTAGGLVTYTAPALGNYFGLYTLEEKVKRGNQRVDIAHLQPQDTNATAITGGYLLKIDDPDANERTFYDTNSQNNLIFVDPPGLEMVSTARLAQYNYITGYFAQFGAALWGANFTNPATGYAAYIDVGAWLDHHIFNALVHNADAFRLSAYFYKDRDQKIALGPLWDFDRSLGTSGSGDVRCFNPRLWRYQATGDQGTDFFGNPSLYGIRWWQRLFLDPDFWQNWIDRWTALRADVLSTNHIYAVIDSLTNQLTKAVPREVLRWSSSMAVGPRSGTLSADGYTYTFTDTYGGEVAFLKQWIADRVNFIDTNFLHAPVFSTAGGAITSGFPLTVTAPTIESNTITYYTLNGVDPRLPGGPLLPAALSNRGPFTLTLSNNALLFARNYNRLHTNLTGGAIGGNPPLSSAWSGATIGSFIVTTPALALTEIMYHPAAPASGTNDTEDYEFIELKNTGAQALNLVGFRFTNGITFTFTATNAITNLGPGQYVVLVANRTAFASRYPAVTNIAGQYTGHLDNSGERLYLEGPLKEPILDFAYSDSWYPTTDGQGFSLVIRNEAAPLSTWTNPASWRPSTVLNGSPGRADPAAAVIPPVVINEALTHTDPPRFDTIELHNPSAVPAAVGGWFLTDDHATPFKFRIPAGTIIPTGGYVCFDESQFNTGASNSFALSSLGEEVYLFSGDGTNLTGYRHGFTFGAQMNGVSFGRYVTSEGGEHFVTQVRNSLGTANLGPKVGPIVINEIMYAPPPFGSDADNLDEYIELRNVSADTVPLFDPLHATNAWKLDGGVQFTFPTNLTMAPWSYLLVVNFNPGNDPVMLNWFRTVYGVDTNTPIVGPFQGNLANEGERVALYQPDKPEVPPAADAGFVPYVLVEEVNYANQAPWPTGADGTGNSLQRIASIAFADDPANWQAAPSSPGRLNAGAWTADTDGDGLPDEWELANGLDPRDAAGANGPQGDADGDGMTNYQEYIAGTNPRDAADFLRLDSVSWQNPNCAITFTPRAGRVYDLEYLQTIGQTNLWTAIQTNLTGTNPLTLYDPAVGRARFYRLKAGLAH